MASRVAWLSIVVRLAGLIAVGLLALPVAVVDGRSADRRLIGRSSQGLPVSVVVRPDHTVYVALTVVATCTEPGPAPSQPSRPDVTVPPEPGVGYRRQLLAFSSAIGARGGFSFVVRAANQRVQVLGRVAKGAVRGQAAVGLVGPDAEDCGARVGFRAARPEPPAAHRASCYPPGTRTLLVDRSARLFAMPNGGQHRPFEVAGCAFSTGLVQPLDSPGDSVYAFLGPALSLRGTLAGYALDLCAPDGRCETRIFVQDLTKPQRQGQGTLVNLFARSVRQQVAKIGSLRLGAPGSVAWIVCPERTPPGSNPPASRGPNCVRAGDHDTVVELQAGNDTPATLDQGRRIDPSSLITTRNGISWIANGRRKHAHL